MPPFPPRPDHQNTAVPVAGNDVITQIAEEEDVPFVGTSAKTQMYQDFIDIAFDTRIVPLILGAPGVGKTALINAVTRKRGMFIRTLLGSTMDPTDVAGLPTITTLPTGTKITEFTKPDWFQEVEDYALANPQGSCIFIDEITTTTPPVQAALLTFIQDRRIGKYFLPHNVLIIAAGNPPSQAADGWQLAPPMANRFSHLNYEPSISDWFAGMKVAWNSTTLTQREKRHRAFIVSFLSIHRDLINKIPDDPEEASKAWPSMRQWDNVARMLGRTKKQSLLPIIVKSCVGEEAASEYTKWLTTLKMLPKYEDVMANPNFEWKAVRADLLYLLMSNVVDGVTTDNYDQTMVVFNKALESKKNDVLRPLIVPLTRAVFKEFNEAGLPIDRQRLEIAQLAQLIVKDFEN
jgi:hypothetical protein